MESRNTPAGRSSTLALMRMRGDRLAWGAAAYCDVLRMGTDAGHRETASGTRRSEPIFEMALKMGCETEIGLFSSKHTSEMETSSSANLMSEYPPKLCSWRRCAIGSHSDCPRAYVLSGFLNCYM